MKNTQALYIFYEKNGIVRNDVLYYLKELNKEISNILIIVNGKITPEGRLKFEKEGYDILANKIIDLVNNPKKMQKISTNAVKTTDKLDWDKCFKSIADFIMLDKRNK